MVNNFYEKALYSTENISLDVWGDVSERLPQAWQ